MGNEQSVDGEPAPETGLRLSTLCRYQAEPDNEEGMATFSWFQSSTDVSGLALRGAHRWGYILSHVGGQRLFKDSRQRFFVLLDHYMCFFDSHAPEARMKGSIDLDKGHCHLELLPRPPEAVDILLQGGGGGAGAGGEGDDHRVEVTRKADEFSMVLCFSGADSLSDWMKSIFDVQQRKATFSRLGHGPDDIDDDDSDIRSRRNDGGEEPPSLRGSLLGGRLLATNSSGSGVGTTTIGINARGRSRGRGGRRRGRRRGTLDSSPPPPRPPRRPHREGRGVPSSWADGDDATSTTRGGEGERRGRGERSPPEDPLRPRSSSSSSSSTSVWLGKASERLAGLPRGGRAAGGEGGIHGGGSGGGSNLDEYGAFTTAQASIYEGWTRGLQPHGWGRMIFANGDCVEGWWEHDVLQGSGATYKSRREGWTFTGGYAAGKRDGPGRLVTAEGDAWECEWRRGVVAPASRGTHVVAAGGEVYQGVCGPSPEDPAVPCRAGQGRLRRRNGEQVDTRFRAGKAVDGAKGVVRFRNGAIFFGELREARPHGYGELYLSSVKAAGNRSSSSRARKPSGSLAELTEMARDVLWYKGNFRLGKPHGSGLIKFKDPLPTAAAVALGRGPTRDGGVLIAASRSQGEWDESKGVDGDEVEREAKAEAGGKGVVDGGDGGGGGDRDEEGAEEGAEEEEEEEEEEDAAPLPMVATDECMMEEDEGEEDESSTDSDEDEDEDEDEEEMEEEQEERGERRFNRNRSRGRTALRDGGEGHGRPGAATRRRGQRPPIDSGSGSSGGGGGAGGGGGGADMEYEAEFVDGVMVRHDAAQLRLAALRFGRAEIRRLQTLLRKEEDAMSRLRVRGLCLLCNAEEMNALLVGCRHHVLCCGCAARAENCPLCGERIGKVVKTYST